MSEIHVTAHLTTDGDYLIECTDCGPVGVASVEDVDEDCLTHLTGIHGLTQIEECP